MSACDIAFFLAWGLLIVGFVDREHIVPWWTFASIVALLALYFC